jgi:hypothetical protein
MKRYAFKKGFLQVQVGDAEEVKSKLIAELGLNSRTSWYNRLNGDVEPKASEVKIIEQIFAEKGIIDIWGD